ncbi:hypothetical protein Tco_0268454 [Tanacetum coccineum]
MVLQQTKIKRIQAEKNHATLYGPPPEEITLEKGGINIFEDNIEEDAKDVKGLWKEILEYFEYEMKAEEVSIHDSLNGKWRGMHYHVDRIYAK